MRGEGRKRHSFPAEAVSYGALGMARARLESGVRSSRTSKGEKDRGLGTPIVSLAPHDGALERSSHG